jgi:hypothetical protein
MSGIYNFVAYLDNKQLEELSNLMEQTYEKVETIFKSDESGKLIEKQIDALLYPIGATSNVYLSQIDITAQFATFKLADAQRRALENRRQRTELVMDARRVEMMLRQSDGDEVAGKTFNSVCTI